MWEIDNNLQAVSFLRAVLFGFIFCFLYDFLRAIRKFGLNSNIKVFIEDLTFFAVVSPITFCFLISTTNGELRFFIIMGIIAGFLVFRAVLSRLVLLVSEAIIGLLLKAFRFFSELVNKISRKFKNNVFKYLINLKKRLKKH